MSDKLSFNYHFQCSANDEFLTGWIVDNKLVDAHAFLFQKLQKACEMIDCLQNRLYLHEQNTAATFLEMAGEK